MLWSCSFCRLYQDFTQEEHLINGGGGGSGFREELMHSGVGRNFSPTAEEVLNFCSGVENVLGLMFPWLKWPIS